MNVAFDPKPGAIVLPQPYLLFLGDVTEAGYAKTAFGLRDWAPATMRRRVRLAGRDRHHGPAG